MFRNVETLVLHPFTSGLVPFLLEVIIKVGYFSLAQATGLIKGVFLYLGWGNIVSGSR